MKIALGTAQFGTDYGISNPDGKTPETEVNDILEYAYSKGIDNIDTASAYGCSEAVIGGYLDTHRGEKWKVVSKLPQLIGNENIESDFDNYFEKSKSHLGGSLHVYLAHAVEQFIYNSKVRSKFYMLKESGSIGGIGVSVYNKEEICRVMEFGGVDVLQLPLNILDHRLINAGVLKEIKEREIEIHARSVFLQGLFFLSEEELRDQHSDVIDPLRELRKIAKAHSLELKDLALLFVKSIPEVDLIIIGVNNLFQLRDNIRSLEKSYNYDITKEILSKINYGNEKVLNPALWNN